MAGVERRGLWPRATVAFTLVLSAWVSSSVCLSLRGLGKNLQHTRVDEATVAGEQRGKIIFDGKDLELRAETSSAAAPGKLLKIILGQSTLSGDLEKEDSTNKEAAWKHLKPSLRCGQSEMEFRATGHKAADLQLDIGAADPVPLDQVPKTCGYTMRKSAPGFVLAVSYDGCNMIQENGHFVLKMRWLNVSVEFICSVKSSSNLPDPYASQSFQGSEPLPVRAWALNRRRRHATGQLYYDPRSLYYYYACLNYYYNMHMMHLAHASATDAPQVPTTTASPPRDHQQMPFYFPYYNPYYHQVPAKAPQSPACNSNTGPKQKRQCQTPADVTDKPHVPTQQTPPAPCTTTAPTTVTANPCPNPERPIGETCLGAVTKYVPFQNLTFRPYISYEAGKPADDQQTSHGSTGGAHPRAFRPLESIRRYGFGYEPEIPFFPPENYVEHPPNWRFYFYYPRFAYVPEGF